MQITDKEILYKSDIHFTPLKSATEIHTEQVFKIIESEYEKAGFSVSSPDTGAVIITGETARKENANAVLHALSDYSGDFVVATAGADLESILSGKGAGSDTLSKERHTPCINFDIGGGTTNISVFRNGEPIDTACFDIGGRLIKYDNDKIVTYISPKILKIIEEENLNSGVGKPLNLKELDKILEIMADVLCSVLKLKSAKYHDLLITNKALSTVPENALISFSGGVAEGIYNGFSDPYLYKDIGLFLAEKIKKSCIFSKKEVVKPRETIRATVVGAGSHTTTLSGSTVYFDEELLPLKNMPVLKIDNPKNFKEEYFKKREWFEEDFLVALSINTEKSPSYFEIEKLANEICSIFIDYEKPLVLVFSEDMAKSAGYLIKSKNKNLKLVCIDSVKLNSGDYIDIASPTNSRAFLPVVVKTLLFN